MTTKKKITALYSFPGQLQMEHSFSHVLRKWLFNTGIMSMVVNYHLQLLILVVMQRRSSADAYMLMYHRQSTAGSKVKAFRDTEISSEPVPQHDDKSFPLHLFEEMKVLNESYTQAPVPSVEEPYFWLTTDWLRQWADNIFPPVLGNTSIQ
ncbi:hypothetical protein MKW98_016248 [Papaver atlanticum]|uniref:Uncharacterized protein n=1 Tax=Papaver atlanticum TaxID=357466 RepID=A0AAD4XEJ8_9MAGN|nr:hypothetical protein MKW98_016248 [Papaver atlanticum]